MKGIIIKSNDLIDFCSLALQKAGLNEVEARIAAAIMTETEMRGISTHGIKPLNIYIDRILNGGTNPKADIKIIRDNHSWALIDGNNGLGLLTAYKATNIAIEKAKKSGISIVGVFNGMHFGAASSYSIMIAEQNMFGLSMCQSDPVMTITGSNKRVIGNNPFSYAFPVIGGKPFFLDVAMSKVAGGKINKALIEGSEISLGLILDVDGNPTKDPKAFSNGGALLPFEDHKGYGFALMVEVLAGIITGNIFTKEMPDWTKELCSACPQGFIFIAIDINKFMPIDIYEKRINSLIKYLKSSPRSERVSEIFIPGEKENINYELSKTKGVFINENILKNLQYLAKNLNINKELKGQLT